MRAAAPNRALLLAAIQRASVRGTRTRAETGDCPLLRPG